MSAATESCAIALYRLLHAEVDTDTKRDAADFLMREFDALAARLTALERERRELRAALVRFVDDMDCRFDRHGNCQQHYVSNPCIVARASAALTSSRETTDGTR